MDSETALAAKRPSWREWPLIRKVYAHLPRPRWLVNLWTDIHELQGTVAEQSTMLAHLQERVATLLHENHLRAAEVEKLSKVTAALQDKSADFATQIQGLYEKASPAIASNGNIKDEGIDSYRFDDFYYKFERQFRGSESDISQRQKNYLPMVLQAKSATQIASAVDIGCGRGEWLRLLYENGIKGTGVDLNARMVEEAKRSGQKAILSDGTIFLSSLPNASICAVTGFHIVEHIPFYELMMLFSECFRVVAPGGVVVFETPNPENILVGACSFYTDPTHRNPIPPPSLGFMLSYVGFHRQDCIRLGGTRPPKVLHQSLENDIVSRFTVGPDYAIVGYKEKI